MIRRTRLSALTITAIVASGLSAPFASTTTSAALAARIADLPSVPSRQMPAVAGPAADEVNASWGRRAGTVRAETVTVTVPAKGLVRAGGTPVSVGRARSGRTPSTVEVRMLSSAGASKAGLQGLGFQVVSPDGGEVSVSLDYSSIAQSVGGDYATRLRLVGLGDCGDLSCPPTVTGAANDLVDETLTADVPVSRTRSTSGTASYTTYGASSGPNGSAGNYTATSASPSDQWAVGIGSGAFTYSYDVDVPAAIGGEAPDVSIAYSSQSVDGRTVAQNGQPSMVGEGWSFEPGYIERKFATCSNGNDLCWSASNEYVLSFGGKTGEIVKVPGTTNEWRMRGQDPAWRILSYTGGANGDNDGEFWVVITPNGVKHWFGLGYEPRNPTTKYTHSAWEVPVYGGSGEPCYNATAANSWCQQAYRWNLDYVKDTNNNVSTYFYVKEYNRYARGGLGTQSTQYVRGGYLNWIEYGQRYGNEDDPHPAQVTFYVSSRCKEQVSCPSATITNAASYPDVPLDQNCTATCTTAQAAPTFWTTKQLDQIKTSVANSAGTLEATAIYDLTYKFPGTSDTTSPSLWLDYIQKTGYFGTGTLALPKVSIDGVLLANRVNTGTGVPPMNKWRIANITNEYGGRVRLTYGTPRPCLQAPAYPNFADNPYHCYPAWYEPPTGTGGWVSFHKYVVTKMIVDDSTGTAPAQETVYTYSDAPAWHYTDSILAPSGTQSWADYRGHARVTETQYSSGLASGEVTKHVIFRGMNGDKLTSTTSKSVSLTDTHGNTYTDHHYLAGLPLDVQRFKGDGTQLSSMMYRYTGVQTANGPDGWQSHDAQYVQETRVVERVFNLDTGSWRDHPIDRTFDPTTNALETASDLGGPGADDDTCTKWGYTNDTTTGTSSTTEWLVDAPYRKIAYAGACGSGSTTVVAKGEYYYDGHVNLTDPPTGRNVTKEVNFISSSVTATTEKTYDAYGRITSVINPNEIDNGLRRKATTTYSPSTGYPYGGVTTKNVLGQSEKIETYPQIGAPFRVTDINGNVTTLSYDQLGRLTSVSRPGDVTGYPSVKFEYVVSQTAPNRVKTSRLLSGTTYIPKYEYLDGLARVIEVQEPPANDGGTGRRVTVTRYDTHGNVYGVSQPMYNASAAGSGVLNPAETAIPFETRYAYDALGRRTKVAQYVLGNWKWTKETDFRGLYERVISSVSDRGDIEYHRDAFGRLTKVVEHPTAGGTANTTYGYTPVGDIETITDDAGRVTTYAYDWLRRRTSSNDPDQGLWTTTYDREGHALTVTDAKQNKLRYVYDALGRKTDVHVTDTSGTQLAHWDYDDALVANGKGRMTAATRFVGGAPYTTRVNAYDVRGRITSKSTVIPSVEGPLQGTYQQSMTYNSADLQTSLTMPAAGGLTAETVTFGYNGAGLPTTVSGADTYVAATTYTSEGKLAERQYGSGSTKVVRTFGYDETAGRLDHLRTTYNAAVIEDTTVAYDAENTVRSSLDLVAGDGVTGQRECFRYEDGLNRLTHAFTTNATCTTTATPNHTFGSDPYDLKYTYDDSGDIRSSTDGMTSTTNTYTYGTTGPKHGVVSVGNRSYEYDANGATKTRVVGTTTDTLTWNVMHELESLSSTPSGGTPSVTTFVYDTDANRLIRRTGPNDATLYLGGTEITVSASTTRATRYYGSFALRSETAGGTVVRILLRNRQNSAAIAVDPATGAVVSRRRYLPYGARRGTTGPDPMPTERGFLDRTEDPSGLVSVGARYYEPEIGRFLTPDPLLAVESPQSLASYTYSRGNPATLVDPTGLMPEEGYDYPVPAHTTDKETEEHSATATFTVPKKPELGLVRINLFIASERIAAVGHGDDRGFTPWAYDDQSRVSIYLNYVTGEGKVVASPSCTSVWICFGARPIHKNSMKHGKGTLDVVSEKTAVFGASYFDAMVDKRKGSVRLDYGFINGIGQGPRISGDITISPHCMDGIRVKGKMDSYPSVEMYQYGGEFGVRTVHTRSEGSPGGLVGLTQIDVDKIAE